MPNRTKKIDSSDLLDLTTYSKERKALKRSCCNEKK